MNGWPDPVPSLLAGLGPENRFPGATPHAGLVFSWRGQLGDFEILDRGRQALIREVIKAIDDPIYLNVCLVDSSSIWVQAQSSMLEGLIVAISGATITIAAPLESVLCFRRL